MRALIIQHGADGPGGHVSDWLAEHGASQDVLRIDLGEDRDPRGYDMVVSLGSESSAYDDAVSWVPHELALLRAAAGHDVPILGICFGSQVLARALGGDALRATSAEIGWRGVRTSDPSLVAEGPWFQWHYDRFIVPPGGTLLAEGPVGPQAYTVGRSLGVQFHPEVTPEIVGRWINHDGAGLRRHGVDPDRLLAETREHEAANRDRAWALMDVFAERVAGLSGSRSR